MLPLSNLVHHDEAAEESMGPCGTEKGKNGRVFFLCIIKRHTMVQIEKAKVRITLVGILTLTIVTPFDGRVILLKIISYSLILF